MGNLKRLILKTLTMENFKGKTFALKIEGKNSNVYGDNGTGKTTIYDAFYWLLFDKDSQFKGQFEIKNLDLNGREQHNLEHTVNGVFDFDGRELTLKKVYSESWTKKRGSSPKEMTGHTTDHFIDSVPVNKKEYQLKISGIATEEQFKLLTSPFYFSEKMKWQDRRAMLMEMCGELTDAEIIASSPELSGLVEILGDRSFDEHKRVISAARKKINEELEKIPTRIDEVVKGMVDCSGINHLEEIKRIESLLIDVDKANARILSLENGGGMMELKQSLAEVETRSLLAQTDYQLAITKLEAEKRSKISGMKEKIQSLDFDDRKNEAEINSLNREKVELERKNEMLRAEWNGIEGIVDISEICPCCGQGFPEEKRVSLVEENNLRISKIKAEINTEGVENKSRIGVINKKLGEILKRVLENSTSRDGFESEIKSLGLVDLSKDSSLSNLAALVVSTGKLVDELKLKLENPDNSFTNIADISKLQEDIASFQAAISIAQTRIATVEAAQKAMDRKTELEKEEKGLAAELEKMEAQLFLMDSFTRTKVEMLEGEINGMFKMARFKLFSDQINGGLAECCSVTYNGVPFETSLNTGARINVGLDIINTMIKKQDLSLPVCIDNSESVASVLPVDAQVIQLIVSEKDKMLRVESK